MEILSDESERYRARQRLLQEDRTRLEVTTQAALDLTAWEEEEEDEEEGG